MNRRNLRASAKAWLFGATSRLCFIEGETDQGVQGAGDDVSIRDELAAALAADPGVQADAAQTTPPAADPAKDAAAEQRARDEQGRFAKSGEAVQAPKPDPKTPQASAVPAVAPVAEATRQPRTNAPPPSLRATAKAEWNTYPPVVREEMWRLEESVQNAKAEWAPKAERLNRLDAILAPRAERFRSVGVSEDQAVGQLMAAQDYLDRDPINAIAHLARMYGVDLRGYAQGGGQQQAQQAQPGQLHPAIQQAIQQAVEPLKSALTQQQQQSEHATRSGYNDQVQAFASDPANVYFENVRGEMGELIRSGLAKDLPDAYQKAVWANPEIRPLMLKQQQDQSAAQAQEAARAKAAQARHASGSVIGSPSPGATPGGGSNPNASVLDDLRSAWNEHAA